MMKLSGAWMRPFVHYKIVALICMIFSSFSIDSFAACGGTQRIWTSTGSDAYGTAGNWTAANVPDSATEDAIIRSTGQNARMTANTTVGCVDVQSGVFQGNSNNRTVTVVGDYFRAPFNNTLSITNANFAISMAGTAPQTLEVVDTIQDIAISNPTTVTIKNSFIANSDLTLSGSGTTIIEGDFYILNGFTIPAGHTVLIKNGGSLNPGSIVVNGTLKIEGGGALLMDPTLTVTIGATGNLRLEGSSGNPARIASTSASSTFVLNMGGTLNADYFVISRATAPGMNVTGTIASMSNGEFRGIQNNGYGITLGAAASVPTTINSIGFFNDDGYATPRNVNASGYNLTAITFTNYAGSVAGPVFENDTNGKINWGSLAPTVLTITDDSETGEPPLTSAVSTTNTFAELGFALNQADTTTDITQVILTMTGTASMSDLASVQAFRDVNANCDYDAGTDTQIGSNLVFSGNPPQATVTIPAGQLQTNSSTQIRCLLVRATIAANPNDNRTVKFGILDDTDVTNSQGYALSATSGTPIETIYSLISNTTLSSWTGATSTAWNVTTNWSPATVPTTARNCLIGSGTRATQVNLTPITCGNANLTTGTLDFNNTTNVFEVVNSLTVNSGFTFSNAATGNLSMRGTGSQILTLGQTFPGNLIINNSGAAGSNSVTLGSNATVTGALTCTDGDLIIPNGFNLTVGGNVTIQTGCTLTIQPGGTLTMSNGRSLTVNTGGTLSMVGTSGLKAKVTSTSTTAAYSVVVNGTISARYYIFEHLAVGGVSIEAGATINATNFLQDGSFLYPVNSNSTLLFLKRQIPGNTLSNMVFDKDSSAATTITNINTTGAGAGTLTITSYSGDVSGPTFDTNPTYLISWSGQTNTILLTQEATSPTSVFSGTTNNMGRFGFKQNSAGASYSNANITSLTLSLTGTGTSTDVSSVKLYSDTACSGTGGTLIGTGTFTGSTPTVTFSITPGALVVLANVTTTVKVCAYVVFDVATTATNGNTIGARIAASGDLVNSQNYAISASTPTPVTLGASSSIIAATTTTWTGATNTAWATASNWTAGVPSATVNCVIPNTATDPIISTGTVACKSINILNGNLTLNVGSTLDVFGDFTNSGVFTQNGTLSIEDSGSNINHTIDSSTTLANMTLAKTGTGTVTINSTTLTINTVNFSSATTTLSIPSGKKLVLPTGTTIGQGTLLVGSNGTLEIGNGGTITVSGGTFRISGTNDTFPQNIATKGIVQVTGGGTNSFNFTATSGTVDLTGFHFERLGVNGLNIGGTTNITNLRGGQLTNLSTTYASVRAIQLNNSGSLPATATNIAWTWGGFNTFTATANTPTSASAYTLVRSTGCGSRTIDFTGWDGDWFSSQPTFNVATKISAASCTINMGGSASAVSLLSYVAVPYDAAIDLRWVTNIERDHLGFNIYRTHETSSKYQQINRTLIRNLKSAGSRRGKYRFIDSDVQNNTRYYYYLEAVGLDGSKDLHGPVSVTPVASLGAPPADEADENSSTNTDDGTDEGGSSPAPIPNPSFKDLGNGIKILSQTTKSMRLEITPETPVFSPSAWNSSYDDVSITGFSKTTTSGSPELPVKDLLIEVQRFADTAMVNEFTVTESVISTHLIAPAPTFSLNGSGVLVPSYATNSSVYSTSADLPAAFYAIETSLTKIGAKKFLKLKINPLLHNPVTQSLRFANKLVFDIGFDGDSWTVDVPDSLAYLTPYTIPNTLRVDFQRSGLYEITYADMVSSEVEGPFKNTDMDDWRLYYRGQEIPLEIISGDGTFKSGDKVRFFAPFSSSLDSKNTQLILSPVELSRTTSSAKRMTSTSADPTNETAAQRNSTKYLKVIEDNVLYFDRQSIGDGLDHYFAAWKTSDSGFDTHTTTTTLDNIDLTSEEAVEITYHVKGLSGIRGSDIEHHLAFFVNGVEESSAFFDDNTRKALTFTVPASRFNAGATNDLTLQVLNTYVGSDIDQVLIDKIEVRYSGILLASANKLNLSVTEGMRTYDLLGFTNSSILGYDVTDPLEVMSLTGLDISSSDGNVTFDAKFFADASLGHGAERVYHFLSDDQFLAPSGLSLNPGLEVSLKSSSNQADLIIYGSQYLIDSVADLTKRRRAQGLRVMTVTPEQVYGEFSFGVPSSQALKNLITTARSSWRKFPRYLLILGDASVDPLDHNVGALASSARSIMETGTLPAPLIAGRFIDFSADNFFATLENSHRPVLAVGRLPTNDPEKLRGYVEKVIDYEEGPAAPETNLKKISFFTSEEESTYDRFDAHTQQMISETDGFSTTYSNWYTSSSNATMRQNIQDEFEQAPLIMSLLGHGAFDRFGDDIFNTGHAQALSNSRYPIVATWNCESSYFYDANKTYKSLSEELVLNPEGGAIIALGSTTQTTPSAQTNLARSLYDHLSTVIKSPARGDRIGDLVLRAKVSLGNDEYEKDIVNSFSIFGDPSLQLPAALFPAAPEESKSSKDGGLFGCSAGASTDANSSETPWHSGFAEFLLYLFFMNFGWRIFRRKI